MREQRSKAWRSMSIDDISSVVMPVTVCMKEGGGKSTRHANVVRRGFNRV